MLFFLIIYIFIMVLNVKVDVRVEKNPNQLIIWNFLLLLALVKQAEINNINPETNTFLKFTITEIFLIYSKCP